MNEIINYKNMTHQHFYENYFLINGKKPPPLSDFDKLVLDAFDNLKEGEQIYVFKARSGKYRLLKCVEEKALKAIESYVYTSKRYSLPPIK